jgi:hypothetical protein
MIWTLDALDAGGSGGLNVTFSLTGTNKTDGGT